MCSSTFRSIRGAHPITRERRITLTNSNYVHLQRMRRDLCYGRLLSAEKPGLHPELINLECDTWETAEHVDHSPDPEAVYFKHQITLLVRREVQKLRPSLRAAMKQYYDCECSLEESARALGVSVAAAKSRLTRGRSRLRRSLRRRGIFDSGV